MYLAPRIMLMMAKKITMTCSQKYLYQTFSKNTLRRTSLTVSLLHGSPLDQNVHPDYSSLLKPEVLCDTLQR
jgi:hypothetical protein